MAVDKLVDSAKLDACLDAEADAIRAKTGGSADIPFDFANNKGFADAIAAIPSGGGSGGNVLISDFLTIYKETVEVGENTVSNAQQYQQYLSSLLSIPGSFLAMAIHPKDSYSYNEWANGVGASGYRYRSGWRIQASGWNQSPYDAIAPVGTVVDVYTFELKDPSNV